MNLKDNFIPSKFQRKIFDFIKKNKGNAVINAKAGSGKTTTLIKAIEQIKEDCNILFVAFNKAIEEEISKKVENLDKDITVKTYHGLGFSLLKNVYNFNIETNPNKYTIYINQQIYNLSKETLKLNKNNFKLYKNNLKLLVDFVRFNLVKTVEEINILCEKYSIVPVADECKVVLEILEWGKNNIKEIDFTDMIWLCIENNISIPNSYKFDYIFIDEAQDSSIMQQKLIKKCFKENTRFIAIGDEFQCINAFAGADNDAFKKFQQEPNTTSLELPVTYRCPKKIVDLVNKKCGINIKATDDAIEGEINYNVSPFTPTGNDMVLCRNTAHLVLLFMKYNHVNKKSYIKGKEIGGVFEKHIKNTKQDLISLDFKEDGVIPRLYKQLFELIDKEIENGLEINDILNLSHINDYIDNVNALFTLSEGLNTTEELIERIKAIFNNEEENNGICLSTVHKAKGLEADNVYILCPSLMPSKYATKDWEIQSEKNLIYVAITRTKKTLNYICEKSFSPNIFFKNESIIDMIEEKRILINKLYDKNFSSLTKKKIVHQKTLEEQINEDFKNLLNKKHKSLSERKTPIKKERIGMNRFK